MRTKRLRIFAGPNGSGKSVLYEYLLSQQYFNNYFYINADVITKGLINGFSFSNWPISISESKSELSYNNFAEICDGECSIYSDSVPDWFFQYVYDKLPRKIN